LIKAIIFDLGDTFIHYKNDAFYKGIAELLKIDFKTVEKEAKKLLPNFERGNIKEKEFWRRLSSTLKIKMDKIDYKNFLTEDFAKKSKLNRSMENLVVKLGKVKFKTAIISNTIEPHIKHSIRKNWFKNFNISILSAKVGMRKPERGIYLYTIKRLGVKPSECIFIDNKEKYLNPAKRLGMKTILFKNYSQLKNDLKKMKLL